MDRPRADCRDPGRRDLGTYCFGHHQPDSAAAGEDHGWRCPVPAVPWQGRLQRSGSVLPQFWSFCFAGIVAVILNSWVRRKPRMTRSKSMRVSPIPAQPAALPPSPPSVVPVQAAASVPPPAKATAPAPAVASSTAPSASSGQFWSPPEPSRPQAAAPSPPSAKPAKPKPPKEIHYNIVGEPISPTEEE